MATLDDLKNIKKELDSFLIKLDPGKFHEKIKKLAVIVQSDGFKNDLGPCSIFMKTDVLPTITNIIENKIKYDIDRYKSADDLRKLSKWNDYIVLWLTPQFQLIESKMDHLNDDVTRNYGSANADLNEAAELSKSIKEGF